MPGNYTSVSSEYTGPVNSPIVDVLCQESNLGPYDCEANFLPHNHMLRYANLTDSFNTCTIS